MKKQIVRIACALPLLAALACAETNQERGKRVINEALSARLATHWATDPPLVVANYPEPSSLAVGEARDLIRDTLGLPAPTRIVLFQGRLGPNLGLEVAAEATLLVPDAVLVLIGFGRWAERSRARAQAFAQRGADRRDRRRGDCDRGRHRCGGL